MKTKNEELMRHYEQIKGVEEEMVRELRTTVDRKMTENANLQKALEKLEN
jgi:hypothetical protein